MANWTTATCSSFTDLISQLNTFMGSNGWTSERLDIAAVNSNSGEWAMKLINGSVQLRFAAKWDYTGPDHMAIYQYYDQDYVEPDRPWGQDHDSGNGAASAVDADIDDARYVRIGTSPIRFWCFIEESPTNCTYIVVETATGEYVHFGFGMLDKRGGDWDGGEFAYGQRDSASVGAAQPVRDGRTHLLDGLSNDSSDVGDPSNGMELFAATIHCEGLPNQPAGGMWGVCMGGKVGSPQTDFGSDRQSNDGVSSDTARVLFTWGLRAGPMANGFYRAGAEDLGGEMRLWPIGTTYVDYVTGDLHGYPIGWMPNVYGCNIRKFPTYRTVTDGTETYHVFPAEKWGASGEAGTTGFLGIAYKQPATPTSLPPSSFADLSAWWDASDADNMTIEDNGRVSQLDDQSGNGYHLLQATDANRPLRLTDPVTGLDCVHFTESVDQWLARAYHADLDPTTGTMVIHIVYRQDKKTEGSLLAMGHNATVTARWGARTGATGDSDTDGDFVINHNDNSPSSDVSLTDTGRDWKGGDWNLVTWVIDVAGAEARLFYNGTEVSGSPLDISAVTDLTGSQPLLVGVEDTDANTHPFEGQIGEISMIKADVSETNLGLLDQYFLDKWSIGTDAYVDPGLPASVGTPTGWYSARDSDDYTESSGEITQLNDKSGNGNHLTPGAGTGPGLRKVRGLNWLNFESSTPTKLEGSNTDINPGSGDFTCVCVFRSSTSTRQGLFYKESDGNEYFGTYIAFSNSRSMRYAMRDTNFANNLALDHDDADNDYTDGEFKIMAFTYDDSEADAKLLGTRGPLAQICAQDPVLENLTYTSGDIIPAATFRLGEWADSSNEHLDGQIAEMIFFDTPLSERARSELYEYLYNKWNLNHYYTDPGLPSALPTVSVRWDSSDEADLTLSGSEITQWDEKSGGGEDWTVPGGKTGPDYRWIRGRKWAHFEAGSNWVMTQDSIDAIEPGSDDWEAVVVYKAEDHSAGNSGAMFGCKNTTGGSGATNTNYGVFIINSDGSLYTQIGENGSTIQVANDTSVAYDDLDARIARVFFDYSADDLYLHGNDPTDIATVSASDTADTIPDVTPDDDAALGDWSTDYDRQFRGQIAEIIIFKGSELSGAQETALETYLSEKWGVEL